MVTKRPYNWSPGLMLGASCTIFRNRPVGTGLGAKIGRKPAKNKSKLIIVTGYLKAVWPEFGGSVFGFVFGRLAFTCAWA
jgi:hypothetical protein